MLEVLGSIELCRIKIMEAHWQTFDCCGHHVEVFEPESNPWSGVIFLNGSDKKTIKESPVCTALFTQHKIVCVCPQSDQSWWLDRPSKEFGEFPSAEGFLMNGVVPFISQRWKISEGSLGIWGVERGGQGALRTAFRHPKVFPVVAAIDPILDFHEFYGRGTPLDQFYDSKEQARQDTAILQIHPSQFPRHIFFISNTASLIGARGADRLHEKLAALGIEHQAEFIHDPARGHWDFFNAVAPRAVGFMADSFLKDSRQLL